MNHGSSPTTRTDLITEQIDGSLVILEPSNGSYLVLSQTGSAIWQLLADGVSSNSIPSHLATAYQVTETDAQIDLATFLGELTERGLLHA